MERRGFRVQGRVQGVGFRAFVASMGEQMGLDGAVWNTRDGEVEVIAAHQSGSVLAEFEARLWKGPGRVDNVSRIDASPYAIDPGFVILPTR